MRDTFECNLQAENLEAEGDVTVHGDLEIRDNVEEEDGIRDNLRKADSRPS